MFQINQYEIKVNNHGIGIKRSNNDGVNAQIINLLNEFEDFAFKELIKLNQFKFVQGEINAKKKFEEMSIKYSNLNCLMITQHPGFIGSIIIDKLLNLNTEQENYLFFFGGKFGKVWNNSSVKMDDLINKFDKLLKSVIFNKELKFFIITISGTDRIIFTQTNRGNNNSLWTIKD